MRYRVIREVEDNHYPHTVCIAWEKAEDHRLTRQSSVSHQVKGDCTSHFNVLSVNGSLSTFHTLKV